MDESRPSSDDDELPLLPRATRPVLTVTLDVADGAFRFEWARTQGGTVVARGRLCPSGMAGPFRVLSWKADQHGISHVDGCGDSAQSTRAFLKRMRAHLPEPVDAPRLGVLYLKDVGPARSGEWYAIEPPGGIDGWGLVERAIRFFAKQTDVMIRRGAEDRGQLGVEAADSVARALLGVPVSPVHVEETGRARRERSGTLLLELRLTFDQIEGCAEFVWSKPSTRAATGVGRVGYGGLGRLAWGLEVDGRFERTSTGIDQRAVVDALNLWLTRFPTDSRQITVLWKSSQAGSPEPAWEQEPPFPPDESPAQWTVRTLVEMAEALQIRHLPDGRRMLETDTAWRAEQERHILRLQRKEEKRAAEAERRRAQIAQALAERRAQARRAAAMPSAPAGNEKPAAVASPRPRVAPPPVAVRIHPPEGGWQETALPLTSLDAYLLRERAAVWWVSNQSDDLLCLPHCRITRLEFQVRAALRALGALRGRALLSDEVGLGKTIEAGLVIKELLTRGMVKRFLVLTLPSLVDQWEEELNEKFGLTPVTTNQPGARVDAERFWRESPAVVASLHTLKQPAQLAIARGVHWDLLIVDEAHHLRNRESQAWQAVNALPRQYLLLLTATPVQNSLEELYNLVTLLKPGQLPSPREFRARFIDPKRPRQPREPEELRRLLGQVMIRNTRANAGIVLPPRRAETVLFAPDEVEGGFWRKWDAELRAALARMPAGLASLWGRLLLQAAGSSPGAWRAALDKFPDPAVARDWRDRAPLESSWGRKCRLLAPLARSEGGVVVFTQFLETQAALAAALRDTGAPVFVINGSTPPPQRQPITDEFHRRGGALLLTHSGTEGRNLQFCHVLANFDLPWNPMEIEQRIGRLHRLGQQRPVHIYNFVQAGTLQEHLLQILQEKLNLFELVVGETGLVLGERFGGDELEEEFFRRWRDHGGNVGEAFARLGDELAAARADYAEIKQLDDTLFAQDFEST